MRNALPMVQHACHIENLLCTRHLVRDRTAPFDQLTPVEYKILYEQLNNEIYQARHDMVRSMGPFVAAEKKKNKCSGG